MIRSYRWRRPPDVEPRMTLGLVGWLIWVAPATAYVAWAMLAATEPVDWVRLLLRGLVCALIGGVFAEWLALRAALRCPTEPVGYSPAHALMRVPITKARINDRSNRGATARASD